jgi:hypothetical protein
MNVCKADLQEAQSAKKEKLRMESVLRLRTNHNQICSASKGRICVDCVLLLYKSLSAMTFFKACHIRSIVRPTPRKIDHIM